MVEVIVLIMAPTTHSAHSLGSLRARSPTGRETATSAICTRPPGRSTRRISANALALSGTRLRTPLLVTTSTEASGNGIASALPSTTSTVSAPANATFRRSFSSICGVRSRARTRPSGPASRAAINASVPDPAPMSSTRLRRRTTPARNG
jgi:hypothetical protein